MKLVYYFLFVQSVYSLSIDNYDIEVEGSLRLGEDLMNKLNLRRSMNVNKRRNVVSHSNLYNDDRKEELEVTPKVHMYLDQVINLGVIEITKFAMYLQEEFVVDEHVTNTFNNKAKDYKQKIKNYITINLKQQATRNRTSIVEKEFMFLDILSFSNKVLQDVVKSMLDKALESEYNRNKKDAVQKVNNIIHKTQIDHMVNIINYICEKMDICRPFPAFSDYIADLITELLKLNDKKLLHLLKYVKTKLKQRLNFFKSFLKQNVFSIIKFQIRNMYPEDMYRIRNLLKTISSTLTDRYTMPVTDDDEMILRSTATRIFIDIINAAFAKERDDLTQITFDTTTKAIQAWKNGNREEIEMPVKLLLEHVIGILRQNWNLATRKEVMILTEVMVLGQSYGDGFDELLNRGSEFVQNGIRPLLK